jgi:UDP-N-acetylglucosamine 2-epimerase (non-hydrolysing)
LLGTRPELVRLSEIIKKLDIYANHILVHTNQNYDYELNGVFFDELEIRKPDYLLDVKSETVGEQIGKIIAQTEAVLIKEKPDAVLILGDTNSALSCIVAKRLKIPIFHMEAGNRCFSEQVPEEINRRIVDVTSDINLCYTEHARRNLLAMGLHTQNIFVTGSPLPEVYDAHTEEISNSQIVKELSLESNKYIVVSVHRDENLGNTKRLKTIVQTLRSVIETYRMPIIFSAHPRTQKKLQDGWFVDKRVQFHRPFSLFSYVALQKSAFVVISDSGTASEDSAILRLPIVTVRNETERPECDDSGSIVVSGVDEDNILESIALVRKQIDNGVKFDNPYGNGACSDRVVRIIQGFHKIVKQRAYGV